MKNRKFKIWICKNIKKCHEDQAVFFFGLETKAEIAPLAYKTRIPP